MKIQKTVFQFLALCPLLSMFFVVFGFTVPVDYPVWSSWGYGLSIVFAAAFVLACLWLIYHGWTLIQDGHERTTPVNAALLNLIPVFNLYWVFQSVHGFSRDYNANISRHGKAAKTLPETTFKWAIISSLVTAAMVAGGYWWADFFTLEPLSDIEARKGVELSYLGTFFYVMLLIFATTALVMWVNIISAIANAINFSNHGPGLTFPWSWLSVPSVIVLWMIISFVMPDFLLPHVLVVGEDAWNSIVASYEKLIGEPQPFAGPTLLDNIIASLREEVFGFGAAVIVSVVCGFLAGFYRGYRQYIVPLNGMFMAIPPIAWAPLMMAFFGLPGPDDWMPLSIIAVIFIASVNPMIITIIEGVLQIQGTEVKAARVLGAKAWQLFVYVYLPASLPFITAALRIGFSQAWRALVAAEMIGASAGIGWSVSNSGEVGDHPHMLLGIAMIGGLSWLFERVLFRPLEKHYEVWRLA